MVSIFPLLTFSDKNMINTDKRFSSEQKKNDENQSKT